MSLGACGEFGLIERIRAQVAGRDDILIGIGDDCCATVLPPGEILLTTTDLLLEEIHFRRAWTDLFALGRKAVAVNISDIAAMGGTPRTLSLGLGLPADLPPADFDQLIAGILSAAREYGAVLSGGDTCRSPGGLMLSVTVQGSIQPEQILRRSGARPGDLLYVSGTLGDSAWALRELLAGRTPEDALAQRHHRPTARLGLGQELAQRRLATALIDLSDGLRADLGHILAASGVGACVHAAALPLSPTFRAALAIEPGLLDLALAGGEDYELLWSAPSAAAVALATLSDELALPLTCIGAIVAGAGLKVIAADGSEYISAKMGYNHFA
ncbi:MAG: thiamine-phosphate kinase [Desulfuromonadales bacterium]|nr:thiamine-phosphate kinase [Desulfuromonadales bacterium]